MKKINIFNTLRHFLNVLLLLLLLVGINTNAWGLEEYVTMTDFNGSTEFKDDNLNHVSDGTFTNSANGVTFTIRNISSYQSALGSRLVYGAMGKNASKPSAFGWSATSLDYDVSVSRIDIKIVGYQPATTARNAWAKFGNGSEIPCPSNGLDYQPLSVSGSLGTGINLNLRTGEQGYINYLFGKKYVDTEFCVNYIKFTYTVTHKEYLFGFAAITGVNNNSYGTATATVANETVQAAIGVKSASTTATFTATPADGCQFLGWSTSQDGSTGYESTANPYKPTLNNTTAGSTTTKTLYAIFDNKQHQTITWNQALTNKVRSNTVTLNATASSGLTVTYTASPAELVSISGNVVTCLKAGNVTITAHQNGNANYHPSSNEPSKSFSIVEHAITKIPTATAINYEQKLNTSVMSGGEANVEGTWAWKYPNSVPVAGTSNQVAVFTPSSSIISSYPLECNVSVTVAKVLPDVVCTIGNEYMVDASALDLQSLWTREGNGTITYSILSFTPTGSNNELATAPAITDNRYLSLGQAGNLQLQMRINEGTNYLERIVTKNITIKKYPNSISCSWGSWSKNLNFNQETKIVFSADNTDVPIVVTQKTGKTIATYHSAPQNTIRASYSVGEATWSVSQAENYKYLAPETKTVTVNVNTVAYECYVLDEPAEKSIGKYGDAEHTQYQTYSWTEEGAVLKFKMWKYSDWNDIGNAVTLYDGAGVKIGNDYNYSIGSMSTSPVEYTITLPAGVRSVKFRNGTGAWEGASTLNTYISHVKVTRSTWLNLQNNESEEIDSLEMPVLLINNASTNADFYINYSTCADEIKVVSNHPHIEVSEGSFESSTSGTKQITITYSSTALEDINATITVYTPSENKTLAIHAQTVKQPQTIIWSAGYEDASVSLPVGLTEADPATASSGLDPVLYSTNNPSVIQIADDGQSFSIIGEGTATLTASQAGDEYRWNATSDTKTIHATDKKIQVIHWTQDFTRSIAPSNVKDLLAEVYINNPLTGVQTKDDARTALIQYSCPAGNGVISVSENQMTVLGYGVTSVTATIEGDEDYEPATMTLLVRVREPSTGCETPFVLDHTEQVQLFSMDIEWGEWTTPQIKSEPILIDKSKGKPDKLSFMHEGEEYAIPVFSNIKVYRGPIKVQERVNGAWSDVEGSQVTPTKYEWNLLSNLQLDENADAIRFVRLVAGQGYHNVKNIQISLLQYLREDEDTIDLGNIQAGAVWPFTLGFDYSDVKGDLTVAKTGEHGEYLMMDETIEMDCGSHGHYGFPITFAPTHIGEWTNDVTITDPITSNSITVHLTANVTKGSQAIHWTPSTSMCYAEPPLLNATATSGLEVSYEVTAGTDVAHIENGEVIIDKTTGSYTITASQAGDVNYFAADDLVKVFNLITPTTLVLTAPTASDITYPAELRTSALTGGSATANGTPVAGSWTWKEPTSVPEVGDAQEITVVFTPSANECLYTGFETTATINVKRAQFVFDGSGTEEDDPKHVTWCYEDNWNVNQRPGSEDEVLIDHNVVIRQEVSVYSVTINEGDTLTIMPTGGLTVGAGGITVAATGKLILKAGTEDETKGQTGYLRISPYSTRPMPQASVELYSTAYFDMTATNYNEDGKWQFVGSPLRDGVAAKTIFSQSFLYEWMTATGSWKNNRKSCVLQPFSGYATSQYMNTDGLLITFAGNLVPNEDHEINLAYNEGDEFTRNMVANSFSAPIDVTKFADADFDNMQSAVYIFNTGSRADIAKLGEMRSGSCNIPGQYLSIPIGSAAAMKSAFKTPTIIASMQGFCVHATGENAKLRLDYEKLVWNGDYATNRNTPLHISAREHEAEQVYSLCVSLYGEGVADNLYMLESNQYDIAFENGYDAIKINSGDANIFAVAGEDKLAVDATNSIIGTRVGVRTGAETAYTFVFSHLQSENGLALYDAETEQTIDIDENTEYTFFAAPETEITDRFQIVARADAPAITTGVDGVENEAKAVKFIKDDQIYILKNGVLYNAMGAVVR